MTARVEPFGGDPRAASLVAYAGGWATGGLIWLLEPRHPDVRFHALQSLFAFGGLALAWSACWAGSFAALLVSASAFFVLQRMAMGLVIVGAGLWAFCLWSVWRRRPLSLPVVGRWAARLSTRQRD